MSTYIAKGPARPLSVPDDFFRPVSRARLDGFFRAARERIAAGILDGSRTGRATALAVLAQLRDHYHHKTGTLCIEVRTLAEAMGLARETVQRAISALSRAGLLEIKRRHTRTGGLRANAYRFPVDRLAREDAQDASPDGPPETGQSATGQTTAGSQGCDPRSHLYKASNPCTDIKGGLLSDKDPGIEASPEDIAKARHLRSAGAGERMAMARQIRTARGHKAAALFAWLLRPREVGASGEDLIRAARLL